MPALGMGPGRHAWWQGPGPLSHLAGLTLQLLLYELCTAACGIYIIHILNEQTECERRDQQKLSTAAILILCK